MNTYQHFLMKKHPVRMIGDFRELVYGSAEKYGKLSAFKLREKTITYDEFKRDYTALCTAFLEKGLKDEKIAIIGANSYGWILSYLAAATVGVAVPIDKELSAQDIDNFVDAADCKLLVGDDAALRKILEQKEDDYIEVCSVNEASSLYLKTIYDFMWEGGQAYDNGNTEIDTMVIEPEKLHVLLFTSGTTGNAKGVCLSQKNICTNITAIASMVKVDPSRHALSVLPIHHTYESTIGHLLLLSAGGCISYCDGLRYVGKNIKEYSPSVIVAVPLLLEFMLRTIDKSIRAGLPEKYTKDPEMSLVDLLASLPTILRLVVLRKVKKSLGGKLKLLIVGAAAIKPEIIAAFEALGITTYQGYGLTETAPLLAGNNDFYKNIESVGLPIHGV
ncbi:MAG: AMP-binding protein, partial [Bacillota bacterium]|nr:AMP-binding protein [Bacillota bacterium]